MKKNKNEIQKERDSLSSKLEDYVVIITRKYKGF